MDVHTTPKTNVWQNKALFITKQFNVQNTDSHAFGYANITEQKENSCIDVN